MRVLAGMLLVFAGSLFAQQPAANVQPGTPGQVTGRVFCSDTGQPGRFAAVQLIADQTSKAPLFDPASLGKDPNFEKVLATTMSAVMKGSNLSTLTKLDGTFSLDKVPAGTYYVVAQLSGYLSPLSQFSQLERMKADEATLKAVESAAEKIVVQANQTAHVEIDLERGASLAGSVRYDDGSPAPAVTPSLLALDKDGKWKEMGTGSLLPSVSDDRGHYRFYGLLPGKYAVKAALPTVQALVGMGASSLSLHMNTGDALVVYSDGALREKDLKPVELGSGEDADGVDVVFPISGLHSVSGTVVAKADNHAIDTGTVALLDPETKATLGTTMLEQDGSFHLNYVLDGEYVLKVTSARDTEKTADSGAGGDFARLLGAKTLKSYGTVELPILVKNDLTGQVLEAPDQPVAADRKSAPARTVKTP